MDSFDLRYSGRGLPADEVVEVLASAAEWALMKRSRAPMARPPQ